MRILVLNAGSTTLKGSVVDLDPGAGTSEPRTVAPRTVAPRTGEPRTVAQLVVDWGTHASRASGWRDHIDEVLAEAAKAGVPEASFDAVGYRVVHGGTRFVEPVLVDDAVLAAIGELAELAPLHNPIAAAVIGAARERLPETAHVAVFDTAFHATLTPDAYRYPVPERWYAEWGIRRFGFHGLSVAWSTQRAAELLAQPTGELRLVVAHLGAGCSVTAVDGGRSVDTSMGMTPLEGLMMATRAGSIDPGIPFMLIRRGLMTAAEIEQALDRQSGLLGVSGRSSDLREILAAAAEGDEASNLAIDLFVRHAARAIAAAASCLPALEALVFTGGIGEHATTVRARIVERLAVLGFSPIPAADDDGGADRILSAASAAPAVLRVTAREDLVIAAEVARVLRARPARG